MCVKTKIYFLTISFLSVVCLIVAGCGVPKKPSAVAQKDALKKLHFFQYPEFEDDMDYDGLVQTITGSLSYLEKLPASREFLFGKERVSVGHMINSLKYFLEFVETNPSKKVLKKFVRSHYRVYRSVGQESTGNMLFTGYYEPILQGSLHKSDTHPFPVFARPDDLLTIDLSPFSSKFAGEKIVARFVNKTLIPYHERKEIEYDGALQGKATPIAWVTSRVDLFFLHIQGSGKIYLDTGEILHVNYHASNGRSYRSVGKLLIDEGKIPRSEMSMQKIRDYLTDFPDETPRILNYNPSYVFFKTETDGPFGSIGVKLTPGRSFATDRRIFPPAALAFIQSKKPLIDADGKIEKWMDFSRFALNQDTGGAIQGPGRVDLFWGNGAYAEIAAGHMQHPGKLYFLVLKPEA